MRWDRFETFLDPLARGRLLSAWGVYREYNNLLSPTELVEIAGSEKGIVGEMLPPNRCVAEDVATFDGLCAKVFLMDHVIVTNDECAIGAGTKLGGYSVPGDLDLRVDVAVLIEVRLIPKRDAVGASSEFIGDQLIDHLDIVAQEAPVA